ncbi:MAG: hypothetical protein LUC33_06335 [Prevotellaceae bacterium]|nr:hypothetical protein [Prevotellaceae bacterium]
MAKPEYNPTEDDWKRAQAASAAQQQQQQSAGQPEEGQGYPQQEHPYYTESHNAGGGAQQRIERIVTSMPRSVFQPYMSVKGWETQVQDNMRHKYDPVPKGWTPAMGGSAIGNGGGGSSSRYYYKFTPPEERHDNEDEFRKENPETKEPSEEELEAARKKERRDKRLANAKSIMDTLSRVANYVATTQGAPSAKWGLTAAPKPKSYLGEMWDKYNKEHKDWLDNLEKMKELDMKANNGRYSNAFKEWLEDLNQRRQAGDQAGKDAKNKADVDYTNAQTNKTNTLTPLEVKSEEALAQQRRASAYQSYTSGKANDKEYYRINENGEEERYKADKQNEWENKTRSDARQLHIPDTYNETSTTSKTDKRGNSDGSSTTTKSKQRTAIELASAAARVRNWNKKKHKEDPDWDINTPADAPEGFLSSEESLFGGDDLNI